MNGYTQRPANLRPRDAGKIASTNVTNEIVAVLSEFGIGQPPGDKPIPYPLHVEITGVGPSDGVYICDVYQLSAGRVPTGTPLTIDAMKGDPVLEDAYFVDKGGSTDELATGTVVVTEAFYKGEYDGTPVIVGLGIPKGTC